MAKQTFEGHELPGPAAPGTGKRAGFWSALSARFASRKPEPSLNELVRSIVREELLETRKALGGDIERALSLLLSDGRNLRRSGDAVAKTGFHVVTGDLRALQRERSGEFDRLSQQVAEVRRQTGVISEALDRARAEFGQSFEALGRRQARDRDEVLAQLSFSINDLRHLIAVPLEKAIEALPGHVQERLAPVIAQLADSTPTVQALTELRSWAEKIHVEVPNMTHDLLAERFRAALADATTEGRNWAEKISTEVPNVIYALLADKLETLATAAHEGRTWAERVHAEVPNITHDLLAEHLQLALANAVEKICVEVPNVTHDLLAEQLQTLASATREGRTWAEKVHAEVPNITHDLLAEHLQLALANAINEGRNWAEKIHVEVPNVTFALLAGQLESLTNAIREGRYQAEKVSTEARDVVPAQLTEQLKSIATALHEGQNWAEKIHVEVPNITHALMGEQLRTLTNTAGEGRLRLDALENTLRNDNLPRLARLAHQSVGVQLSAFGRSCETRDAAPLPFERYEPARPGTFDSAVARAKAEFPQVFDPWWQRLEATDHAFEHSKIGNAANEFDLYSCMFRDIVRVHARGRMLDVGCGVFGRPYYLRDYPADLISGIEPLTLREPVDFEVVRGIGEYLPWPEGSFSTVLSATSLDHSISLDRALDEIHRVLTDDGKLIMWLGLVPGSPPFDPMQPDFQPADQYHLFHFDKSWIDPLLDKNFEFIERIELDMMSFYSHAFYVLRKRPTVAGARS